MTLKGEFKIVLVDAFAVVGKTNTSQSAGFNLNLDVLGIGVEAVLDKFLNDGSGSFNDLASGYLVRDAFIK